MNRDEFAASIDHTVLGPETTWDGVRTVLDEAAAHGMNACIPPCYVAEAAEYEAEPAAIATVVGFPHGQHDPTVKRDDVRELVGDGGATVPDVELMSEYLPVKASGGVGSYEEATAMLDAGAVRIGASSGVAIVEGHPESGE
ncbi:hypothetical protein [Halorubrum sp. SD683]|uniref:hypothetical protein n=1 Tax=Halorubrum sp. SD683 TaxID=1855873 RepID=UPI000A2D8FEF|nr:hypothetical protein [Halorubrum sp. SD683]OTF00949.1 hypothetical protein B9G49_05255 [Halorubrum sp. SD683]